MSTPDPTFIHHWLRSVGTAAPLIVSTSPNLDPTAFLQDLALRTVCTATQVPCGKCRECRAAQRGLHPDVVVAMPEGSTWTIKGIRAILTHASKTTQGAQRLIVIREPEKLSLPAANAFLKSLEEPSVSTRYLLLTHYPGRLLPTIRSRSQMLRLTTLPPLSRDESESDPTELTLKEVWHELDQQLRSRGPNAELRRGLSRLRDYYLIKSRRGNTKLAYDVCLLSQPDRNGTP